MTYWRTGEDRRGHAADLTLETRTPIRAEFSWGRIAVVDRLGVENVFATLGGELRMDRVRAGLAIAVFTSPARSCGSAATRRTSTRWRSSSAPSSAG